MEMPAVEGGRRMSDLISRKAAIDVIDAVFPVDPMKSEYAQGIACGAALAKTYVEQMPSAQTEIIRCKDCKYYVIHTLFGRSQGWCERLCDEFDRSLARGTEPDDFCSRAERRTDETD